MKIFESGLVFTPKNEGLLQTAMFSGAMMGERTPQHWAHQAEKIDFYDVKGQVELILSQAGYQPSSLTWQQAQVHALHPGQSAEIYYGDLHLGTVGMLHPKLSAEFDLPTHVGLFELNLEALGHSTQVAFKRPSKYPGVRRDLSLQVAQSQPAQEMIRAIEQQVGALLQDCFVFDVYEKGNLEKGQKSIALGMILQDESRTLVEDDVEKIMQNVVDMLKQEFGALLRE